MHETPWKPEREVTAELAQTLIESSFPELSLTSLELLGTGWDNVAYLANGTYVFRFPRRQMGVDLLAREIVVLPRLQGRLPLAVPTPVYVGKPGPAYPWPFYGYRRLEGTPWELAPPPENRRAEPARTLARFLRRLHDVPAAEAEAWGVPRDPHERSRPDRRAEKTLSLIEKMSHDWEAPVSWKEEIEEAATLAPSPRVCLVHGDLHLRHLLLQGGRLTGIIDWGDLHLGSPAVDLAMVPALFPASAQKAFFEGYGEVDRDIWKTARLLAGFFSLALLDYASQEGHGPLARECRACLDRLAALNAGPE